MIDYTIDYVSDELARIGAAKLTMRSDVVDGVRILRIEVDNGSGPCGVDLLFDALSHVGADAALGNALCLLFDGAMMGNCET